MDIAKLVWGITGEEAITTQRGSPCGILHDVERNSVSLQLAFCVTDEW